MEQIDHNKFELNDRFNKDREFVGNDDMTRGNFRWEDGIQDTNVIWEPDDVKGRFFIKNGCHPLPSFSNKKEEKFMNMKLAMAPIAADLGTIGVDPYNRTKNADGRGSKGAMALNTKSHTYDELPNDTMIMEYIDRPKKVSLFYEDVIMAMVYFSVPILSEQSNDEFLRTLVERGYRHYSMNNPFKSWSQLTPTEQELGGAPAQDTKIGDQQFYVTEAFVEDHVGIARDERHRPKGVIGDMPFTRTLYQLKEVDTEKRTKYDAYISFSLSKLGNKKPTKKKVEVSKTVSNPFSTYNNKGLTSKRIA